MTTWHTLHGHFLADAQALVELCAHAWRQAALANDDGLSLTLATGGNSWSAWSVCDLLQSRGFGPDQLTLEWARMRDGMPPPVPFFVMR